MTGPSADDPRFDLDLGLLDDIRALYQAVDPMPANLPERIRFLVSLRDLEIEMARLADDDLSTARGGSAGARGSSAGVRGVRGTEQSRTITFDSESLTVMIRIDANGDGTVRVDGWLAPPQRREIDMKTVSDPLNVTSDEQGRFAFARVPSGTAQLIVRPAAGGAGPSVVTPALIL